MKFKASIFLLICFFSFIQSAMSQTWELEKENNEIKAYTANKENSSIKLYKIVATIKSSADCVFSTVTDYDNYTIMFKELSKFDLISKNDSVVVAYSLFEMPWPFNNRDLIAKIKIKKQISKTIIYSQAVKNSTIEKDDDVVRIIDYSEKFIIEKINNNETKFTIIGHIDVGGSVPVWVQNMFIIDGPMDLIEIIKGKCK